MERVLVVDDDPQVLALVQRWLRGAGYEVVAANDFRDARIEMRMGNPDVVVVDVRLGEFNGMQLALLAQQTRPDVRLVLMSGWDDQCLRRDAQKLGAAYLCKPLSAADLVAAVRGPAAERGDAIAPSADQ